MAARKTVAVGVQRHETKKGHYYTIDGKRAVGVTTGLNGIPKDALKYWAAGEVAAYVVDNINEVNRMLDTGGRNPSMWFLKEIPFQKRDEAAVRGTEVHALAEQYIRGESVDVPDHLLPYVEGYAAYIEDFNPTSVYEELVVCSRTHLYAGTLDSIQDIPGIGRAQVDYKTGNGVYGEYALQVAAYRYAEFMLDADDNEQPMPAVERTFILHIKPNDYELIEVAAAEVAFEKFLVALRNYRENVQSRKLDKLIIGPVEPPQVRLAVAA